MARTEEAGAAGTSDSGFRGRGRLSLLPGVVKTYAPAGLTPVVYEWQSRDHLSVKGGLTLHRARCTRWVHQER
jgi:hypothetical protein